MRRKMRMRSGYALIALLAHTPPPPAFGDPWQDRPLAPFASDLCSLFPEGTPSHRSLWCECCVAHDLAYWRGGTWQERRQADQRLLTCIEQKSTDPVLARAVYLAVRVGGTAFLPTGYRWGYGWPFPRGYRPLSASEQAQASARLDAYQRAGPHYCEE